MRVLRGLMQESELTAEFTHAAAEYFRERNAQTRTATCRA